MGKGQKWCAICEQPIGPGETVVGCGDGSGDGSDGNFAHASCYRARVVAKVRLTHERAGWTAELRLDPPRFDVWRGVEWIGQWEWREETFGARLQGRRRITHETLTAIANAIRDRESRRR